MVKINTEERKVNDKKPSKSLFINVFIGIIFLIVIIILSSLKIGGYISTIGWFLLFWFVLFTGIILICKEK